MPNVSCGFSSVRGTFLSNRWGKHTGTALFCQLQTGRTLLIPVPETGIIQTEKTDNGGAP